MNEKLRKRPKHEKKLEKRPKNEKIEKAAKKCFFLMAAKKSFWGGQNALCKKEGQVNSLSWQFFFFFLFHWNFFISFHFEFVFNDFDPKFFFSYLILTFLSDSIILSCSKSNRWSSFSFRFSNFPSSLSLIEFSNESSLWKTGRWGMFRRESKISCQSCPSQLRLKFEVGFHFLSKVSIKYFPNNIVWINPQRE